MVTRGRFFSGVIKRRSARGFTLIEICIVLVIMGLMMMSAMGLYRIYLRSNYLSVTAQRQADIHAAMITYFNTQGVLP